MSENQKTDDKLVCRVFWVGIVLAIIICVVCLFLLYQYGDNAEVVAGVIFCLLGYFVTAAIYCVMKAEAIYSCLSKTWQTTKNNEPLQNLARGVAIILAIIIVIAFLILLMPNFEQSSDDLTIYRQESLIALCNTSGRQLDMSDITIYVTDNTSYTISDHFETAVETVAGACWCFKPEIAQVTNQRCTADNTWNGSVISRNVSRWVNAEIQVNQNNTNIIQCGVNEDAIDEYRCREQE